MCRNRLGQGGGESLLKGTFRSAGSETLHSNKLQGEDNPAGPCTLFQWPPPLLLGCLKETSSQSLGCPWDNHLPGITMTKPFENAQLFILVQERELWKAKDTQQVGWGSDAFALAFPAPYG